MRNRPTPAGEHLNGIGVAEIAGNDVLELLARVVLLAVDEHLEQQSEVREVVVDDRAGDPRRAGDRLDRDAAVPLLHDHAERRIEQLLATLLGWHPRGVLATGFGRELRLR